MAGHIPAGMELFAAGDEEQLTVIRRWIDESDAFLLILGARYGSIDPKSGKSYIELEYSYAVERRKPLFAVVINSDHIAEHLRSRGPSSVEAEHLAELQAFRELVATRMIRFWRDEKDIKLAILETLREIAPAIAARRRIRLSHTGRYRDGQSGPWPLVGRVRPPCRVG